MRTAACLSVELNPVSEVKPQQQIALQPQRKGWGCGSEQAGSQARIKEGVGPEQKGSWAPPETSLIP